MKKEKNKNSLNKEETEVPTECEMCLEPSSSLNLYEETKEWICYKCMEEIKKNIFMYEDNFSYSHRYYMNGWDEDN